MYLYVLFFILLVLSLCEIINPYEIKTMLHKYIYFNIICVFFLLSSLRWETGTDWDTYHEYYQYFKHVTISEGWLEPGYTFLSTFVKNIFDNYSVLLCIMAVIIYTLKYRVIYDYSPLPLVSLFAWLTISLADIFPTRQFIALAITFYSVRNIIEQKKITFVALVILASLFHASSMIFIFAYYVFYRKFDRMILVIMIVASYAISLFAESIISNTLSVMPFIQDRINVYMEDSENTFGSVYSVKDIIFRGFVNKLIIFIPIFTLMWSSVKQDRILNGIVNLIIFGTILSVLVTTISPALARIGMYYDVNMQILLFPYFLILCRNQFDRVIVFFVMSLYFLYRFYGVILNYYDLYIPYKSILFT